jgi:ribokinase
MERRIIGIGGLFMDIIVETDALLRPGETKNAKNISMMGGGKEHNQALAAKRLGGNVSFIGRVGNDNFGPILKRMLEEEGIDSKNVSVSEKESSPVAVIMVREDGQNAMLGHHGSMKELDVNHLNMKFNKSDIVLAASYISTNILDHVKKAGATVVLNASPFNEGNRNALQYADYIIINSLEASDWSGSRDVASSEKELAEQAKKIRARSNQVVIITRGDAGVFCDTGKKMISIPGRKVKVVDTAGAGDCFMGAFAVGISEGRDLNSVLEFANMAASLSVQKKGTSSSFPKREDLEG